MKQFSIAILLASSLYSSAQDSTVHVDLCCSHGSCCTSAQTPAGVMTDHIHLKGQLALSYYYMVMGMRGSQIGNTRVSEDVVYRDYTMSPKSMTMQMHMVMAMYGITDRLTAMLMTGFMSNAMSMNMNNSRMQMPGMQMTMGTMTMTSDASGITDSKLYGLYNISRKSSHRLIASLGISIPTGMFRATGITMLGEGQRLPYNMQVGTGSFSLIPDFTYSDARGNVAYGANTGADIKLNFNSLGYKAGNIYHATAWASYAIFDAFSCSIRPEVTNIGKIAGSDKAMDIPYYQTADPSVKTTNYGGTWANVFAGVNVHLNHGALNGWTLKAEYGLPVYQDVNGTQTSTRYTVVAAIQYAF